MITRIEIDGFKTFANFSADLRPFVAVVGPNATGKSNMFDALKFLARLAETDVRQAMQDLRGEPDELFRRTSKGTRTRMKFALEVLLPRKGTDDFGTTFETPAQRLRYEIEIAIKDSPQGIFVTHEDCRIIRGERDRLASSSISAQTDQVERLRFLRPKETRRGILVFF